MPVAHTSDELLHQAARPERLVVLGGGYIGLEFASMYAGYGSSVTVLERRPALLAAEDDDIADTARRLLIDRGVKVHTAVDITEMRPIARPGSPPAAQVQYLVEGHHAAVEADVVLVAFGRRPNTAQPNLDQSGVQTTAAGAVVVDEHRRASQPHIFATAPSTPIESAAASVPHRRSADCA